MSFERKLIILLAGMTLFVFTSKDPADSPRKSFPAPGTLISASWSSAP